MADFASSFQALEDFVKQATGGFMSKFDQMTFKMLVNNLKSTDYYVVTDTLDQLAKENKPIAIPPVYYVYSSHPDPRIRDHAARALARLDPSGEVEPLVEGKSIEDAVRNLIAKYGNYRQ